MEEKSASQKKADAVQKIESILNDIKSGMMTTISPNNQLHSRPMMHQLFDPITSELWFFTSKATGKVTDIEKDARVNVAFASPSSSTFVSLYGVAEITDDKAKEKELWNPLLHTWFPEGLADPNLVLIRVKVHSAEYWDNSASLIEMIGFTSALFTGQPYQASDDNQHERIYLN